MEVPLSISVIRAWLRTHPYTLGLSVVLAILSARFLLTNDSEWEDVYINAALNLRAGADLYESKGGYVYPPFMAWAVTPLSYLSQTGAEAAWLIVNLVSLLIVLRGAWWLAGGR